MKYTFKAYQEPELLTGHLKMGDTDPAGNTIDVTSSYFTKNGTPWIGVMGEFHFSRYDHREWRRELAKMKAGGITVVASYLFWIHHEEVEGCFDFSGNNDLRGFIEACRDTGLDVFLRIGPWAHGECRNGGFPDWLLEKGCETRTNDKEYLHYVRIFYQKVFEQIQGLQFCEGGNIVGLQIENELARNAPHLAELKKIALECGFRAPIYTITGWGGTAGTEMPVEEFVPVFGGYCEGPWFEHTEQLPPSVHSFFTGMRNDGAIGADLMIVPENESGWQMPYERYPFATCELGGGIEVTHHRRPIVKPMDIYSIALTKLGCGNNLVGYYMFHGGTNPIGKLSTTQETKETGYPNDYAVLSYDFQAPLSEYGEVRGQYRYLNMLHLFVKDFDATLAPMSFVEPTDSVARDDTTSLRYGMRTDGKGGLVFVNHYQRLTKLADVHDVVFQALDVEFPAIDVCGDIAFFLPFHMDLGGNDLICATAQPLCRVDSTYFFAEIPGVKPTFRFEGTTIDAACNTVIAHKNVNIVVLTAEQAAYARKLSGKLYIGCGCDLYEYNGELCAVQGGDFCYTLWNGTAFEKHSETRPFEQAVLTAEAIDEPFTPPYLRELTMNGERKRIWKQLTVSTADGFIEIPDACDVSQIYADGTMVADNYYIGVPWRVPAALLYGKTCYLVMSELKNDFYREF